MTSFARDIRPLFRESDRVFMGFYFDLWNYDEVRRDATEILERVMDGTMPCDAPWPASSVNMLRAWIKQGCPP